jgi:hypothetical protein
MDRKNTNAMGEGVRPTVERTCEWFFIVEKNYKYKKGLGNALPAL